MSHYDTAAQVTAISPGRREHGHSNARRLFTVSLMALLLGISVLASSASPAAASSLDGQDPIASGCSAGAYTVVSTPIRIIPMYPGGGTIVGTLELRYSPSCGTNWVR